MYIWMALTLNVGSNWRHLRSKYGMEECKVMQGWDERCKNESESVRVCEQQSEMCSWGDIVWHDIV